MHREVPALNQHITHTNTQRQPETCAPSHTRGNTHLHTCMHRRIPRLICVQIGTPSQAPWCGRACTKTEKLLKEIYRNRNSQDTTAAILSQNLRSESNMRTRYGSYEEISDILCKANFSRQNHLGTVCKYPYCTLPESGEPCEIVVVR